MEAWQTVKKGSYLNLLDLCIFPSLQTLHALHVLNYINFRESLEVWGPGQGQSHERITPRNFQQWKLNQMQRQEEVEKSEREKEENKREKKKERTAAVLTQISTHILSMGQSLSVSPTNLSLLLPLQRGF